MLLFLSYILLPPKEVPIEKYLVCRDLIEILICTKDDLHSPLKILLFTIWVCNYEQQSHQSLVGTGMLMSDRDSGGLQIGRASPLWVVSFRGGAAIQAVGVESSGRAEPVAIQAAVAVSKGETCGHSSCGS